jgi:pSer/pThr/pTyr-binding forkhead associated (FHA) protein
MTRALKIGREPDNDIFIPDLTVSRYHGQIYFEESGMVYFEDLNSSNGSFVNGNQIYGIVQLQPTDILKVGKALVPWHDYRNIKSGSNQTVNNSETNVAEQGSTAHAQPSNEGQTIVNEGEGSNEDPHIPPTKIARNNRSMVKKYWPVLAGILVLVLTVIFLVSRTKNSKEPEDVTVASIDTLPSKDNFRDTTEVFEEVDADKDGVVDEKDGCPDLKGPKANNGCPYADYDKDGTPDKDDECKYDYGPRSNNGCPNDRTNCPYCYQKTSKPYNDSYGYCDYCNQRYYYCYRPSIGAYSGIKMEWFYDGACDCSPCYDE